MTSEYWIYIVDDDETLRDSIAFALETSAFRVKSFDGARTFLAAVDTLEPGCVLMDVRMPDIDGLQVVEALGDRIEKLPVVVMTGHGDVSTAVRAMKMGASDFLEKPFEEDVLLQILERTFKALDARRAASELRAQATKKLKMLTPREDDVLRGLAAGFPNKVIAFRLGLSVRTVEMHRSSLMDRLGVRSLSEALRIAFLAGLEVASDADTARA